MLRRSVSTILKRKRKPNRPSWSTSASKVWCVRVLVCSSRCAHRVAGARSACSRWRCRRSKRPLTSRINVRTATCRGVRCVACDVQCHSALTRLTSSDCSVRRGCQGEGVQEQRAEHGPRLLSQLPLAELSARRRCVRVARLSAHARTRSSALARSTDNKLRFVFTNVDPKQHERPFVFGVTINEQNMYQSKQRIHLFALARRQRVAATMLLM